MASVVMPAPCLSASPPVLASSLSELTDRLQDVDDLPPQQELARWLMATQVKEFLLFITVNKIAHFFISK
jgi:hypothetical protein